MSWELTECHSLTCMLWTEQKVLLVKTLILLVKVNIMMMGTMIINMRANRSRKMTFNGTVNPPLNRSSNSMEEMAMDGTQSKKQKLLPRTQMNLRQKTINLRISLKLSKKLEQHKLRRKMKVIHLLLMRSQRQHLKSPIQLLILLTLTSKTQNLNNQMTIHLVLIPPVLNKSRHL